MTIRFTLHDDDKLYTATVTPARGRGLFQPWNEYLEFDHGIEHEAICDPETAQQALLRRFPHARIEPESLGACFERNIARVILGGR
jgi:hypothetical protein